MVLKVLHHPSFHDVLDEVRNGAKEPTPIREFGSLISRPNSYEPDTGTRVEIVSDGIYELQKHRR